MSNRFIKNWVFYICCLCSISLYGQRPDFSGPGLVNTPGLSQTTDTLDRPPLKRLAFNLDDFGAEDFNLDSSLYRTSLIEPYYNTPFSNLNTGSENGASQPLIFELSDDLMDFGHKAYDHILKSTSSDYLQHVNRSYWDVHYGQDFIIGSSNFSTSFYTSFQRGIGFNFDYHSLSDNGWPSNFVFNKFKKIDIKFFQRNEPGSRTTYVHYEAPRIIDHYKYEPFGASIDTVGLEYKNQSITVGNIIHSQDTTRAGTGYLLHSDFTFFDKTYKTGSPSILGSVFNSSNIVAPSIAQNGFGYRHSMKGFSLKNDIRFYNPKQAYWFGLELHLFSSKFGELRPDRFFKSVVRLGYERQINSNYKVGLNADLGLDNIKPYRNIEFNAQGSPINDWQFFFTAGTQSLLPYLSQIKLVINDQLVQNENWNNIKNDFVRLQIENHRYRSKIEAGYSSFKDLIVVGSDGLYRQLPDRKHMVFGKVSQEISLGPFLTRHHLLAQSIDSDIISLPKLYYSGHVALQLPVFKKKMLTEWGVDVKFMPSYDTPEFFPITGSFTNTIDFDDRRHVLLIHPYLSAKVSQFHLFVKGVNLPRLLTSAQGNSLEAPDSDGLNLVSGFPIYNYRVRVGIKWTLLD